MVLLILFELNKIKNIYCWKLFHFNLKKSVFNLPREKFDNLCFKFLQFLQVLYEFLFLKDLRAKVKPSLAHEQINEFYLIQRRSKSESESDLDKNQRLNQCLN